MTEVDTSIYKNLTPPPNPLETMTKAAGLSRQLGENQLTMQAIKGRQAMSQIIAKNTDENGDLDRKGALRDIAKNPDAAYMFNEKQSEMNAANPLVDYMGKGPNGQPTPMRTPMYNAPGLIPNPRQPQPGIQVPPNALMGGDQAQPSPDFQGQPENQLTGQIQQQNLPPQAPTAPTPEKLQSARTRYSHESYGRRIFPFADA